MIFFKEKLFNFIIIYLDFKSNYIGEKNEENRYM